MIEAFPAIPDIHFVAFYRSFAIRVIATFHGRVPLLPFSHGPWGCCMHGQMYQIERDSSMESLQAFPCLPGFLPCRRSWRTCPRLTRGRRSCIFAKPSRLMTFRKVAILDGTARNSGSKARRRRTASVSFLLVRYALRRAPSLTDKPSGVMQHGLDL
jgi:hypothetical protein